MANYRGNSIVLPTVAGHDDIPTPDSGKVVLYVLSGDSTIYQKDDAAAVTQVGSSPGGTGVPVVADESEVKTPEPGTDILYFLSSDGSLYRKDSDGISALVAAGTDGDFQSDGSVQMTGDLNLDAHAIILDDIATPANPASGKFKLYLKSDGNLYIKNSAGTEVRAGNVGDFLKDGTVAMTGDFNIDAHAFLIDDITTPGSNPASGKFKLYLKSDGNLYTKDSSGTETKLTRTGDFFKDGSVGMTADLPVGAHSVAVSAISTPSNPASGFLIYMKSDGFLYARGSSGGERKLNLDSVFFADGSAVMTADLRLQDHRLVLKPVTWASGDHTSTGSSGIYYNSVDGHLWMVDDAGNHYQLTFGGRNLSGSVGNEEYRYLAVPKFSPGSIYASPSTEGWLVLRSDSRLKFRYGSGESYVDGDLKSDGSVSMAADFPLIAHAIVIDDISTPSYPSAGIYKIYLKSDLNLYLLKNDGSETQLTGVTWGTGDLKADGSVSMSGEFPLNAHDILFGEISTPASNPTASKHKVYIKADGKLYKLDHDGTETELGAQGPPGTDGADGADGADGIDGGGGDFLADGTVPMTGDLLVEDNAVRFTEIATPGSNPPATKHLLYFKSDGNAYTLDHNGVEVQIGSGGGDTFDPDTILTSIDGEVLVGIDGNVLIGVA